MGKWGNPNPRLRPEKRAFWLGGDWPRFHGPHHGGFQTANRRRAILASTRAIIAQIDGLFLTP